MKMCVKLTHIHSQLLIWKTNKVKKKKMKRQRQNVENTCVDCFGKREREMICLHRNCIVTM